MNTHADKTQENKSQSVSVAASQMQSGGESTFQFIDNRPEAVIQGKLQEIANKSLQDKQAARLQAMADSHSAQQQQPIEKRASLQSSQRQNNTGLPDNLKSGIEGLSGYSMDDVKVHYNSSKPAQLRAHAYAQGTDIHIGPGKEKHLPHEAWHVVQQKQGRVSVTRQLKGKIDINDDPTLESEADLMGEKASQGEEAHPHVEFQEGVIGHNIQRVPLIQLDDEEIDLDDRSKTGDDWYGNKDSNSRSSTAKAKKKYQQLLYSFFDLTDQTNLATQVDAVDISTVDSNFLAMIIAMHKHIAPFRGDSGQGFDRTGQGDGSYVRSNTAHGLNTLHKQLLELKGRVPTSWIQPLNTALLELQAKTRDQANVDKLILDESGTHVSTARLSLPSAGLPSNNMEILNRAIDLAKTRGTSNFYMIQGPRRGNDQFGFIQNPVVQPRQPNGYHARGPGEGIIGSDDAGMIGDGKQIDIGDKAVQLNNNQTVYKGKGRFVINGRGTGIYQGGELKHIHVQGNATGTLTDPSQTVDVGATDTREASNRLLFGATSDPGIGKSRRLSGNLDKSLERLDGPAFQQTIAANDSNTNAHDAFLQERAQVINAITAKVNGKVPGVKAIGSEDHPSLILHVPQNVVLGNHVRIFYGAQDFTNARFAKTADILPLMITDFNQGAGGNWQVQLTRRGSFGFQRPTLTDTGDSVRFWPGYAPIEVLTAGLTKIMAKLEEGAYRSRGEAVPLPEARQDFDLSSVSSNFEHGLSHLEGLKTAMRHTYVALKNPELQAYPSEKQERVARWLKIRMLIKLKQAETVLKVGDGLVGRKKKNPDANITNELEKNLHLASDLVDKLQEYSFVYTTAVMPITANPNLNPDQPGKFKDESDPFEVHLKKSLEGIRGDHRVFYLDSGEQALVAAGLLANRFKQNVDANVRDVPSNQYQDLDSYFEVGVFGGARRSNLDQNAAGDIVHADMSPVITSGDRMSYEGVTNRIKDKWQLVNGTLDPAKSDVIPILDITNSSLSKISALGAMPNNFILVESLTKHEQLGADKFIMGRLIAVSNTAGTAIGGLNAANFLDLAQTVVGPVANKAYNPVLHKLRRQMDEALYKKANPDQFALVLHPTAARQEPVEPPTYHVAPEVLQYLHALNGGGSQDPWQQIMQRLAQQQIALATTGPKIDDVD